MSPDVSDEIIHMWQAFKRVSSELRSLQNPEGNINSAILDGIMHVDSRDIPSICALSNFLKFMVHCKTDDGLLQPTERRFMEWYRVAPIGASRQLVLSRL